MNCYGDFGRLALGSFVVAAMAFLVSGCTEVGSPAVHDMPAPRIDTTLTPDQVKRATDDLATQRDHLESNAAANGQPAPPVPVVASGPQGPYSPLLCL